MKRWWSPLFLWPLLGACSDPLHDDAVDALGPEQAGVRKGPYHRPGQPCLTCHGGEGPAGFEMSLAGTVYAHAGSNAGLANVIVRVVDADHRTYETRTNCAGNFWVPASDFQPVYPLRAAVTYGTRSRVMLTPVHREGSCSACHAAEPGPNTPGRVWVLADSISAPVQTCPRGEGGD